MDKYEKIRVSPYGGSDESYYKDVVELVGGPGECVGHGEGVHYAIHFEEEEWVWTDGSRSITVFFFVHDLHHDLSQAFRKSKKGF